MQTPSHPQLDESLAWLRPGGHGSPKACLQRIRWLCEQIPDLHGAAIAIAATHQGVPRDQLAAAMRKFRPDLQANSDADVTGMLNGLWNGGKEGLEAVQRSRKVAGRRAAAMSFVKTD